MEYTVKKDCIEISGNDDFVPEHILECGQIFSYKKEAGRYEVYSLDKCAILIPTGKGYALYSEDVKYFENFFDLKTDYSQIKRELSTHGILKSPVAFGHGIRILKQNLFQTLISFIVSSNNNIKRIQLILNRLCERLGERREGYYAFPTEKEMLRADKYLFAEAGAGYRAEYLYKAVRQVDGNLLEKWRDLPTPQLRSRLLSLAGVGPKVADCVLLFGYGRQDVFPVDTWINRMYNRFYTPLNDRERIRENLIGEFGSFSGYAQQYLFYYGRSEKEKSEK